MGLSNRDNDFLIETFRDSGYTLDIYTDKDFRIGSNITGYGDIVNNRITKILYKYKVLLISLVKPDISSGQLTAIHALKYGIPIVADDANGIRDFVIPNKTGYLLPKEKEVWLRTIKELISNPSLYQEMSDNCKAEYIMNRSIAGMAHRIGDVVLKLS